MTEERVGEIIDAKLKEFVEQAKALEEEIAKAEKEKEEKEEDSEDESTEEETVEEDRLDP